jgi:hypothetical protein
MPLINQDPGNSLGRENWSPPKRAGGDKVNWMIEPNPFESTQMLVHLTIVARAEGSGEILTHPLCRRDHRSRLQ